MVIPSPEISTGAGACFANERFSSRDVVTRSAVKWKRDVISPKESGIAIDGSKSRKVKWRKKESILQLETFLKVRWLPRGLSYCPNGASRFSKISFARAS